MDEFNAEYQAGYGDNRCRDDYEPGRSADYRRGWRAAEEERERRENGSP